MLHRQWGYFQIAVKKWPVDHADLRPDVAVNHALGEERPTKHAFQRLHATLRGMQGEWTGFVPAKGP